MGADGDFPARAKVISELQNFAQNPDTPLEKIVNIILSEPTLGTRILHLVNSVVYVRENQITTVSQAVTQIGLKSICDMCSGFILLQGFGTKAKRNEFLASNLKHAVLSSIFEKNFSEELKNSEGKELGYLTNTLFHLGPLLLSYYFPQIYENAKQRAEQLQQTIAQSLKETIELEPYDISLSLSKKLSIPDIYKETLGDSLKLYKNQAGDTVNGNISKVVASSNTLTTTIFNQEEITFAEIAKEVKKIVPWDDNKIANFFQELPELFRSQTSVIELDFIKFPELKFIKSQNSNQNLQSHFDYQKYLTILQKSIDNKESLACLLTRTIELIYYGLKYERVLILLLDNSKTKLVGKISLGKSFHREIKEISLPIEDKESLLAKSYTTETIINEGKNPFGGGDNFFCFNLGASEHNIGVIYADTNSNDRMDRQDSMNIINNLKQMLHPAIVEIRKKYY